MRKRRLTRILSALLLLWLTAASFAAAESSEPAEQAETTPEEPAAEAAASEDEVPAADTEAEPVACLPVDEAREDGELELTDLEEASPTEAELDLSDADEDTAPDVVIDVEPELLVASPTLGLDEDEAIEGYIQRQLYAGTTAMPLMAAGGVAGSQLGEDTPERRLYDRLCPLIRQVADGELASTAFIIPLREIYDEVSFTAEDLGVDALLEDGGIADAAKSAFNQRVALNLSRVLNALMVDLPYELYWYDKTLGTVYNTLPISYRSGALCLTNYDTAELKYSFRVAAEYSVSGETKTFDMDVEKAASIQIAAENARRIVAQYADCSDIEKLYAYKDSICELASYNYDVSANSVNYGNPWQLVWVFDGDEATKVVCEGYAKAFQYLCELSAFSGDVSVVSAFGKMVNEAGTGGEHMWNNVRIGGSIYLADITNCDTGCAGYPDQLFLKGCISHSGLTYSYKTRTRTLSYTYGEKFTALFSGEDLVLSENDALLYSGEYGGMKWLLDNGGCLYIQGSGAIPNSTAASPAPWCVSEVRARVATVSLSEGITRLGDRAFYGCSNLERITLPRGLTDFGVDVFEGCPSESIVLSDCANIEARLYAEAWGLSCELSHGQIVTDTGIAASCTEDGLTEGSHCEVCGDVIVAREVVPAKGHSPEPVAAVAPTETSTGLTEGSRCAVCGVVLVEQRPVAMLAAPQDAASAAPDAGQSAAAAPDYTVHVTKNTTKSVNKGTPMQIVVDGKTVKSYKSSNKKVATVSKTGWVTTKKAGTAKITITLKNKKKLTLKVKVVDPTLPKSVKLLEGKSARLQVGQTLALSAVMSPDTAVSTLKWKSGNKKIATVNQQGVVTAKKAGKVKITVTTRNKKKAVITIRVVKG